MTSTTQTNVQKLIGFLGHLAGLSAEFQQMLLTSLAPSFPVFMTVGQFLTLYAMEQEGQRILVPHPRQRETAQRLAQAMKQGGHLSKPSLAHTEIVVAFFRGMLYLIDGNHRAKMWAEYPAMGLPSHVNLIVKCFGDDEAVEFERLYYAYDSKASLETGRHKMFGYAKYAKEFKTKFMQSGAYLSAMTRLNVPFIGREVETMDEWETEIRAFDEDLARSEKKFNNGIIAALFLLYRKERRADVTDFFGELQTVAYTRKKANELNRPLTPSQQVVVDFKDSLAHVVAKNNEGVINIKRDMTLRAYGNYKSAFKVESKKAKRLINTAAA